MGIDVDDGQGLKILMQTGVRGGREKMSSATSDGKLTTLQHLPYSFYCRFKSSGVIHATVIQRGPSIDANFDRTAIQFLIIKFHLAGSVEKRLRPMSSALHIANAVFQRCWNDRDASGGRVTEGSVGCAELCHRGIALVHRSS